MVIVVSIVGVAMGMNEVGHRGVSLFPTRKEAGFSSSEHFFATFRCQR